MPAVRRHRPVAKLPDFVEFGTLTLNDRSEAMFGAMAQRHLCQAIDLDSFSLV